MTDSQHEDEEHLPPDAAEPLQEVEGKVEDRESRCIWTQDAARQEELIQFHEESSQTTTLRRNATYEHCRIQKEHMDLYKDKIGKIWDPEPEFFQIYSCI